MRALSKCLLNTDRHGAPKNPLRSLFQHLTTLTVSSFFLMPSLILLRCSFVTPPHVPPSVSRSRAWHPSPVLPLFRELQKAIKSPLGILFSRVDTSSILSLSPYMPVTSFGALLWVISRTLASFFHVTEPRTPHNNRSETSP